MAKRKTKASKKKSAPRKPTKKKAKKKRAPKRQPEPQWTAAEKKLLAAVEAGKVRPLRAALRDCLHIEVTDVLNHLVEQGNSRATATLAGEVDVNAHPTDLTTPLMSAVQAGDGEMVRVLIEAGADVNYMDSDGFDSAISIAATSGDEAMVRYLLDHGANDGEVIEMAAFQAVKAGHLDVAELLLPFATPKRKAALKKEIQIARRKAAPKSVSAQEARAFITAAKQGDLKAVRAALKAGIRVESALDKQTGGTALHIAAEQGHHRIVSALLEAGADPNRTDDWAQLPLMQAQDAKTVQLLIEHGADPNARNEKGIPVLFWARARSALVEAGADIHAIVDGCPLLVWLFKVSDDLKENVGGVEMLLQAGADACAASQWEYDFGILPIHLAAQDKDVPLMELLVRYGADMSATDAVGKDAMHHLRDRSSAREKDYQRVKRRLIRAKLYDARIDRLALAVQGGDLKKVQRLLREGAPTNALGDVPRKEREGVLELGVLPLALAAREGSIPICQALLDAGADPNAHILPSEQPLYAAAEAGHYELVELLLEAGADPNAQGRHGEPVALHAAAAQGHPDIVQTLLAAGADVHQVILWQLFPRETSRGFTQPHLTAIQQLLDAGIDVNHIDNPQWPVAALDCALYGGNKKLIAMLKSAGAKDTETLVRGKN